MRLSEASEYLHRHPELRAQQLIGVLLRRLGGSTTITEEEWNYAAEARDHEVFYAKTDSLQDDTMTVSLGEEPPWY